MSNRFFITNQERLVEERHQISQFFRNNIIIRKDWLIYIVETTNSSGLNNKHGKIGL